MTAGRWVWRTAGAGVLAASSAPLVWHYLGSYPQEIWQVDLEVYREGARALVGGFPLYDLRTDAPQFLPFTYPPFAAFTALPLLLAPFAVMGWVWTLLQLLLLWWTVGMAFRPFLQRARSAAPLAQGVIAAACVWMLPVAEGIRFGQVNAVIVALCLWDLTRRGPAETRPAGTRPAGTPGLSAERTVPAEPAREGYWSAEVDQGRVVSAGADQERVAPAGADQERVVSAEAAREWPGWCGGSGIGVGLAAAVKLTPGIFWLHWAVARRWRTLGISVATAAAVTVAAALMLPSASAAFWTDALLDPERLGPNAGTSNQSLRGFLLRVGPAEGVAASALWAALALAVVVGGLALARRLDRLAEPVAVVAVLGMVAFLVSPVSWVHHLHWGVVVVAALLGDGRRRARVIAAIVLAVLLWMRLPWWGANLLAGDAVPRWTARIVQNSYTELAVLALVALWWLVARPSRSGAGSVTPADEAGRDDVRV